MSAVSSLAAVLENDGFILRFFVLPIVTGLVSSILSLGVWYIKRLFVQVEKITDYHEAFHTKLAVIEAKLTTDLEYVKATLVKHDERISNLEALKK